MIHIDQIRVPAGGWHFHDLGMRLQADTYQELYKVVLRFRLQNRAPIDTIQEDINRYIASISPTHVIRTTADAPKEKSLADKVYDWSCHTYDHFTTSKLQAPLPEAERRAEICLGCHNNKKYHNSCPSCRGQTDKHLSALRQGRHSAIEDRLHGCSSLAFDIPTAILLEDDLLGAKADRPDLPDFCWRRPNPTPKEETTDPVEEP